MQITPITNPYYNTYRPAFGTNTRCVKNKTGQILYRNTTNFFRKDLKWDMFGKFLKAKYKNTAYVNVINYACSDGSEPLSVAILLNEIFGKEAKKFFPLIAKDFDRSVICMAKGDYVNMDYYDYEAINRFTNGKFNKYFKYTTDGIGFKNHYPARVNPYLKKLINFSVADIRTDTQNIPSRNTILFCRNFWPYIKTKEERAQLVRNLALRLQVNCTLITGNYDNIVDISKILIENGFKHVKDLPNVYEKVNM